jgi:hypothetical protein
VRLSEHPDFEQAIIRTAEHFAGQGLRPAIIEKDRNPVSALARRRTERNGRAEQEGLVVDGGLRSR